jgi:hypothetical protein
MPVKTTDISSNLSALLGPEGGSWGFLYSSCIPQQPQGNDQTLKKSALSQQQLGQVSQGALNSNGLLAKHTSASDADPPTHTLALLLLASQLLSTISRDTSSFPGACKLARLPVSHQSGVFHWDASTCNSSQDRTML